MANDRNGERASKACLKRHKPNQMPDEAKLKEAERRLTDITRLMSEWIWEADEDLRLTYVSSRVFDVLGYHPSELVGLRLTEIGAFTSDEGKPIDFHWRSSFREVPFQMADRNGAKRYFLTSGVPVFSLDDESLQCVRGIARDITKRKQAENTATVAQERLVDAIESISEAFVLYDAGDRLVICNKTFREFHPWSSDNCVPRVSFKEIEQRGVKTGGYPDAEGRPEDWLNERLAQHHDFKGTYVTHLSDGRWLLTRNRRTHDGGIVSIHADITELKKAEEEKAALEGDLRQAQKMQALGQLTGGIAHEFNNLLSSVSGYAELALEKMEDGGRTVYCLEQITNAAKHATALTNQMLAFSRKQVLVPEIVLVHDVIENMTGLFKPLSREDHELIMEIENESSFVRVDAGQLSQAILNLAINARDAMPGSGTLTIGSRTVYVDEKQAKENENLNPGYYVVIFIQDTGDGIPEEVRGKIFDPFFTTKEVGEGTGVGVSMVYGMVVQSGGAIEVESAPGKGTTFTIYLARLDEAEIRPELEMSVKKVERPMPVEANGKSILLVEDDEKVREVITINLRDMGFSVFAASNGIEAVSIYRESDGEIDILISDVEMPKMRGPELANQLFENKADLGVILISGYSFQADNPLDELDERYREMCHCIQKPVPPAKLSRVISQLLDRNAA